MSEPWHRRLLVNRWLAWLLLLGLAGLLALTGLQYLRIEAASEAGKGPQGSMLVADASVKNARILNDYEDFYVVGRLWREGDILAAYDNDYLMAAQQRFTGAQTFMPWAYPPQLTALMPLLPLAGLGGSFLLFMGASLAIYFVVLLRCDARHAGAALLAVYPALVLDARLGQNGFLTGALIGLFLLAFRARRDAAGAPLGLMVIKPHLAAVIGLLTLLERRWKVAAIAAAIVVATSVAATLVLGTGVWPTFLSGIRDAGGYLREGAYPLYRMSSVYAGVRSFDLPANLAMAVHVAVAMLAIGLVALAWRRKLATNRLLALAGVASVFISPYNYDYDLACLAVALCLVLPELLERMDLGETLLFYALAWVGSGAGLAQHFHAVLLAGTTAHPHGSPLNWSFQAMGVLAAAALAAKVLRRERPNYVREGMRPIETAPRGSPDDIPRRERAS